VSVTDRYVENNRAYFESGAHVRLPIRPSKHVVVVTCMDARIDVYRVLGLKDGEANVLRNAGGVVTEDVLRSLVISQRLLGTTEIILIHHTGCGMMTFTDDEMRAKMAAEAGYKPLFALHAFASLEEDVREGLRLIAATPFILHKDHVRGFVLDIDSGELHEVVAEPAALSRQASPSM
jgi:carbonic anhydrase